MRRLIFAALLLTLLPSSAKAQGIPVYDSAGFAQLVTQLDQMSKDYQKQLEQLDQAIKQTDALTGTRGMGSLANTELESQLRRYLPNTWQETMQMMNAGGLSEGALGTQGLYSSLYSTYQPVTGANAFTGDPTGFLALALDRKTETTYAAMAASEQAYNNAVARMETYETLLGELDKTEDLKASVDLQSRIAAENGIALNELMRLNAIQIQQNAATDNENLMGNRRANAANRYDADSTTAAFKPSEE